MKRILSALGILLPAIASIACFEARNDGACGPAGSANLPTSVTCFWVDPMGVGHTDVRYDYVTFGSCTVSWTYSGAATGYDQESPTFYNGSCSRPGDVYTHSAASSCAPPTCSPGAATITTSGCATKNIPSYALPCPPPPPYKLGKHVFYRIDAWFPLRWQLLS